MSFLRNSCASTRRIAIEILMATSAVLYGNRQKNPNLCAKFEDDIVM